VVTVDLRLTVAQHARSTVVHVDGRLRSENLQELQQVVRAVSGRAVIDLTNLLSVDDAGVAMLRTLAGRGARLVGASPYVALLLEGDGSGPPPVKGPAHARGRDVPAPGRRGRRRSD
jgi:anti-anti-sigma regulatory factor